MANSILVWVVDDDESIRWVLEKGLSEHNIEVELFESAHQVILKLESENPDLILTDIKMPGTSGIDLLDQVQNLRPEIPVIVMTAHSDLESAVESYEHGAWEYLPKPFDINEAVRMVERATISPSQKQEKENEDENNAEINVDSDYLKGKKLNIKFDPEKNSWKFIEDIVVGDSSADDGYFENEFIPAEFDKLNAFTIRNKN